MSRFNAMVIGASGGIGIELVKQLVESGQYKGVYAISRSVPDEPLEGVSYVKLNSDDEAEVASFSSQLAECNIQFSCIICCTGILQDSGGLKVVKPEKRLEDIHPEQLLTYFKTNAIIPTLWIKHSERLLKGQERACLVLLSARVGSISDNKLGGWYGYRASKAALNMLVKTAQIEFKRRAPNVSLLCYHPGTVDTDLSRPFQANVASDKLLSANFSVSQLLQLIPQLNSEAAPYYLDWQGKSIQW